MQSVDNAEFVYAVKPIVLNVVMLCVFMLRVVAPYSETTTLANYIFNSQKWQWRLIQAQCTIMYKKLWVIDIPAQNKLECLSLANIFNDEPRHGALFK